MSKVIAVFLCLILTLWGIPQTNKVSAAELALCSSNEIATPVEYTLENSLTRYPMSGKIIPEETNAIYFKLSGKLTTGHHYIAYIKKEGELLNPFPDEGYSTQAKFNNAGDTIELSLDKNNTQQSKLFKPTLGKNILYGVYLLETTSGSIYNKNAPKCHITDYQIGQPISLNTTCNIKLDDSNPGPGQFVTASVSNANRGNYDITYSKGVVGVVENNKPDSVTIDDKGNGSFTFKTGQSFIDKASIVVSKVVADTGYACKIEFTITNKPVSNTPSCVIIPIQDQYSVLDKPQVVATNLQAGETYWARIINRTLSEAKDLPDRVVAVEPQRKATFNLSPMGNLAEGKYAAEVYRSTSDRQCTSKDFSVGPPGTGGTGATPVDICKQDPQKCTSSGKDVFCDNDTRIRTAIGCIHTSPVGFIKDFLKFIIGISGGLAFLMMLLGAFQMVTSAGNPETLQAGRDRFQSAIIGLLFVIFAVLLLQIIGVGILDIPGFGR